VRLFDPGKNFSKKTLDNLPKVCYNTDTKTKEIKKMSDLELVLELLRRARLLTKKLEYELPAGWNKGNSYVNLTFEDGKLNGVEIF
jgi:hypothetical protein